MLDYLIMYEHKVREFDNVCLLKAELERRGYSVGIIQSSELHLIPYMFWKRPKVYVPFCLYNDETCERLVWDIVGNIRKIFNLHWEQALSRNALASDFAIPTGYASEATHLCWGQEGYDLLAEAKVKNLVVTGAPQMDFLREEFKGIYRSRAEIDKEYNLPSGKLLLYISTFIYASMTKREQQNLERTVGYSMSRKIEENKKIRKVTLKWLSKLLDDFTDYYIVYRPHPGENIDDELLKMQKMNPRFYIIKEDSIKQWIIVADEIVTFYSSSLAEVFYAKKNCIILRPYEVNKEDDIIIYDNATFITSYEDFVKELQNKEREFPIPAENIEYCYGKMDEVPAYYKVCDELEKMLNTSLYDMRPYGKRIYFKGHIRRFIKSVILKLGIRDNVWPFRCNKKLKDWLTFFWHYQEKNKEEYVTTFEIESNTQRMQRFLKEY